MSDFDKNIRRNDDCSLGDCDEIMPTLKDNFANTGLLTDPPYGIGESNERALSRGKIPRSYNKVSRGYDSMTRETQTTEPDFLYSMQLGEAIEVRPYKVTRVPGGWLWHTSPENATFVPFNNEFQPRGVDSDCPI